MPAAKQQLCEFCNRPYWASRSDSKWCSDKCRCRQRVEDAKFSMPIIPTNGVPGVTYKRSVHRWDVRAKVDEGLRKYVGTFVDKTEAIEFLRSVEGHT